MNLTEAQAVNDVLDYLLNAEETVGAARASDAAGMLALRAHKALGAGWTDVAVLRAWPMVTGAHPAAGSWAPESPLLAGVHADRFLSDPRFGFDQDPCCDHAPGGTYQCTRGVAHLGRHIATGLGFALAAWPGSHEPTPTDLDGPQAVRATGVGVR